MSNEMSTSFDQIDLQLGKETKEQETERYDIKTNQSSIVAPPQPITWNQKTEYLLQRIGEKSMGYRWMHEQEHLYHTGYNDKLQLYLIVLTGILGTLSSGSIIGLFSDSSSKNNILLALTITQLIMSFIMGVVLGIKEQGDYKMTAMQHKQISSKFAVLYHSIQRQFSLDPRNREDDKTFLNDKIREFDDLVASPNVIRNETMTKYNNTIADKNISKVDDIETFDTLRYDRAHTSATMSNKNDARVNFEVERWIHNF
jgi:hypothetical protein